MKNLLFLFLFSCFVTSCSKDDFNPENEQDIISYLENNNINATKTTEGLYYII